jgi:hypothetical protein
VAEFSFFGDKLCKVTQQVPSERARPHLRTRNEGVKAILLLGGKGYHEPVQIFEPIIEGFDANAFIFAMIAVVKDVDHQPGMAITGYTGVAQERAA